MASEDSADWLKATILLLDNVKTPGPFGSTVTPRRMSDSEWMVDGQHAFFYTVMFMNILGMFMNIRDPSPDVHEHHVREHHDLPNPTLSCPWRTRAGLHAQTLPRRLGDCHCQRRAYE